MQFNPSNEANKKEIDKINNRFVSELNINPNLDIETVATCLGISDALSQVSRGIGDINLEGMASLSSGVFRRKFTAISGELDMIRQFVLDRIRLH